MEVPNFWVVIKIPNGYKVFAGWSGGYLDGDSWKLNSGIKSIELIDNYYHIIGYSGSLYKCKKDSYGIRSFYCLDILDSIVKQANKNLIEFKVLTKEEFREVVKIYPI